MSELTKLQRELDEGLANARVIGEEFLRVLSEVGPTLEELIRVHEDLGISLEDLEEHE